MEPEGLANWETQVVKYRQLKEGPGVNAVISYLDPLFGDFLITCVQEFSRHFEKCPCLVQIPQITLATTTQIRTVY